MGIFGQLQSTLMSFMSDDPENMTEGKYVYWTKQDDDVPRGHVGEIVDIQSDGDRRVKFPNGKWNFAPEKLNMCDFQKGTFVHATGDDYDFDTVGEVKDLEDGKFIVEIKGEKEKEKPKHLVRCDFQPGMYVFWIKSDDDIPAGHMGEVLADINDEGRVKVKFPNGRWRFRPSELVRGHVQPGAFVQWKSSNDDIATGELGKVTGSLDDDGKVEVQFAKDAGRFRPEELIFYEIQTNSFVNWRKSDDDVETGDVGRVERLKDNGKLLVAFPKGSWSFHPGELRLFKLQPGMLVTWESYDDDIGKHDIGRLP
ncbi:unnamed protein product [Symbiodinium sp. CCMP2592]|nr:unnamed protein product [Symbiodinium sp. CCMP2592]